MKNIFFLGFVFLNSIAFSQKPTPQQLKAISDAETKRVAELVKNKAAGNANSGDEVSGKQIVAGGGNTRISFIAGVGASAFFRSLYLDPVVNPTNNNVQLQLAKNFKTNLSLGIAYTPYTYNIISTVSNLDDQGNIVTTNKIESVPKGWTGAVFINPVLFSKISENQNFFTSPDFGFGLGYRFAGGISLLGTGEFFWVRQPRDWFINQYKDNNAAYVISGSPQKAIDLTDNSIFNSKPVFTLGIKIVFTFDIIKNFISSTTTTTTSPATTGLSTEKAPLGDKKDSTKTITTTTNN